MLFDLEGVSYSRGGKPVLDRVAMELPRGASCLAGPSGSGKSTLLRLLNRLADPDSGRVLYEGADAGSVTRSSCGARSAWCRSFPR